MVELFVSRPLSTIVESYSMKQISSMKVVWIPHYNTHPLPLTTPSFRTEMHSLITSNCCRDEDEEFSTVDHLEPATNDRPEPPADVNLLSPEPEIVDTVKLNLEDGATDGKRPTVVQMMDGTIQLQRGRVEFMLKKLTRWFFRKLTF